MCQSASSRNIWMQLLDPYCCWGKQDILVTCYCVCLHHYNYGLKYIEIAKRRLLTRFSEHVARSNSASYSNSNPHHALYCEQCTQPKGKVSKTDRWLGLPKLWKTPCFIPDLCKIVYFLACLTSHVKSINLLPTNERKSYGFLCPVCL